MNHVTEIVPNQSILVVVPYAVEKSKPLAYLSVYQEIAEKFSCDLVFFSAIYDRAAEIDTWVSGTYLDNFRKPLVKHHQQWLEEQAKQVRKSGIEVDVIVNWAKRPVESLQEYMLDRKVSLIIDPAKHHGILDRVLHRPIEWELIRLPEVPVLLMQNDVTFENGAVALALDVAQSGEDQDKTNEYLIQTTNSWVNKMGSRLSLINAYPSAADFLAYAPAEWQMPELQGDLAKQHQRRLESYKQKAGLAGDVYVGEGQPGDVVDNLASEIGADLLVIGSRCRTGLSGWVIGNAAEAVLENSKSNILVLKP